MVMVEAPGGQDVGETSASSANPQSPEPAALESNFEDAVSLLNGTAESSPPPEIKNSEVSTSQKASDGEPSRQPQTSRNANPPKEAAVAPSPPPVPQSAKRSKSPESAADDAAGDSGMDLAPNANWSQGSTQRRLKFAAVAAVAAVALVAAAAVFSVGRAFIAGDVSPSVAEDDRDSEQRDPPGKGESQLTDNASKDEVEHTGQADKQGDKEKVGSNTDVVAVDPTQATSAIDDGTGTPATLTETDPVKLPSDVNPDDASDGTPMGSEVTTTGTDDPIKNPPLLTPKTGDPAASATEPVGGLSLLAELEKFGEFLGDTSPDDPLTATEDAAGGDFDRPLLPRPSPIHVSVADRLADPIDGIEFRDVPLLTFLRFATKLSTIPISLDPAACWHARISPDQPVSVRQVDTTLAAVLKEVLESVSLTYVIEDEKVRVVIPAVEGGELRKVAFAVDDLTDGQLEAGEELVSFVTSFVEPQSWKSNGGVGVITCDGKTLNAQQNESTLLRVLSLLERLRVARGLPIKSDFDVALFATTSRYQRAADALAKPVTMNFLEPTRFVEILKQCTEQTGVQILVDWQAIASIGWNPNAEMPFSMDEEAIGDALSDLASQMGISLRVIDKTTVQFTSREVYRYHLEVEAYSVLGLLSEDRDPVALITQLRAKLGERNFIGTKATLKYDDASGCLFASLPQPLHVRLAQILEELPR